MGGLFMIRFLTFEQFHNRRGIGSTNLRVHNLIKYWPEADIYKYGENPEAMIFQKVYMTQDYKFHKYFEGVKILDICDPDWFDGMLIKETVDAVDGVTCPTEELAKFIRQLTDKPVRVIPDRHDTDGLLPPKQHTKPAKRAVWFGYKQNAQLLQHALPSIEQAGLSLTVISNEDPYAQRWALNPEEFDKRYYFIKYKQENIIWDLQQHDICILPSGTRTVDRFKSDNKTTLAWLAGLPVAKDGEDMRRFIDPVERQKEVDDKHPYSLDNYDCRKSVTEMKAFIEELKHAKA
jgi:hypothetical protein